MTEIAAIATTPTAARTLGRVCENLDATLWLPEKLQDIPKARLYTGSLKTHLESLWGTQQALILGLAVGAVVRLIAPLLRDKGVDPAVLVIDPEGKFVISLCGGHQGGGDRLTREIATLLGATPIITGASQALDLPGIDVLGVPFGWRRGKGDWTAIAAAVAHSQPVQVIQEAGSALWQKHLPSAHPFVFDGEEGDLPRVYITPKQYPPDSVPQVSWHPRVLWVGMGCERGTSLETIKGGLQAVFEQFGLSWEAIAGIATIDLKSDEVGFLQLCQEYDLPLKTFPPEVLRSRSVPHPSDIVEREVGTPSVAEAAALQASQTEELLVPKQIFKGVGAVTIAIAQSSAEYSDRLGSLYLIGTGPGSLDQMTLAAQKAVTQADVVIGYKLYIELLQSLLRPGQIVEALPITQERQRALRGIELAQRGLTVAVVSSGDCGIYGMAGLVLEELRKIGWDGKQPHVRVFPGVSAVQAAASRVGAPLMHDFCTISLSDLLTPWEVIEKRLKAAAVADFVVALYNPRSQKRTEQIAIAQGIFLEMRSPSTPVAIVRSAYRDDEQIQLTTLGEMLRYPIDMLSVVLIGNQSTCQYEDLLITPRGYNSFNLQGDCMKE
ncbi:MAG: precorrin-3B C(17)-methyltransferase [Jaaginema sp. PMC 1079.18]|nr:precorrin-3B C(17)-methyltransferase [Jaaginema sp. PMC 1080.18]MEC4853792.1 precorrin-3B C(17)-methyltransferase [Jaaginema sp. PMC 1079.18]MEC4865793.1 precorrin-3B C(17)-methyltransferase [Jaaginema sp. PMC 1078.18]